MEEGVAVPLVSSWIVGLLGMGRAMRWSWSYRLVAALGNDVPPMLATIIEGVLSALAASMSQVHVGCLRAVLAGSDEVRLELWGRECEALKTFWRVATFFDFSTTQLQIMQKTTSCSNNQLICRLLFKIRRRPWRSRLGNLT